MASMIRKIRRNMARNMGLAVLPRLVKPAARRADNQAALVACECPDWTHMVSLADGTSFGVKVESGGIKAAKAAAREHLNVSRLPVGTTVEAC